VFSASSCAHHACGECSDAKKSLAEWACLKRLDAEGKLGKVTWFDWEKQETPAGKKVNVRIQKSASVTKFLDLFEEQIWIAAQHLWVAEWQDKAHKDTIQAVVGRNDLLVCAYDVSVCTLLHSCRSLKSIS
jgi:hypothetical protein